MCHSDFFCNDVFFCQKNNHPSTHRLQNFRTSELQNLRTSEPQNFRTSELQNFRTSEPQNFLTPKQTTPIFVKTIYIIVATISTIVNTIINIVFAPLISNIVALPIIISCNDVLWKTAISLPFFLCTTDNPKF